MSARAAGLALATMLCASAGASADDDEPRSQDPHTGHAAAAADERELFQADLALMAGTTPRPPAHPGAAGCWSIASTLTTSS